MFSQFDLTGHGVFLYLVGTRQVHRISGHTSEKKGVTRRYILFLSMPLLAVTVRLCLSPLADGAFHVFGQLEDINQRNKLLLVSKSMFVLFCDKSRFRLRDEAIFLTILPVAVPRPWAQEGKHPSHPTSPPVIRTQKGASRPKKLRADRACLTYSEQNKGTDLACLSVCLSVCLSNYWGRFHHLSSPFFSEISRVCRLLLPAGTSHT